MKSGNEETNGKEASGAEDPSEFASSASNTGAVEESRGLTGRGVMESANNAGDSGNMTKTVEESHKLQGNLVYQGPDEDNALLTLADREFFDEKTCDENGVSDEPAEKILNQTYDDNGLPDEKAQKLANSDSCRTKEGITFNEQPAMNSGIVGDITLEGLLTLGLPMDICSQKFDNFHCYSMAEIRFVLSLPGPHTVQLAGVESLDLASKVMVNVKKETSEGWIFPDIRNLEELSEINDLLGDLRADLKAIRTRCGDGDQGGNNSATSSAIKTSFSIRKKADSLASKIQKNIAVKLCKLIVKDFPHSLHDNFEELAEMAKAEQKKPVWFLKGGSSRRKTRNVRRVKQLADES